tara:strand:- start:482 stop:1105 length:624 start_codon:yes stop_codon:yes gene_type:complete
MSGKLLGLDAINSNTLSNEFCQKEHKSPVKNKICKICFSFAMLESYRGNCIPNFENNSVTLSTMIHEDFSYLRFRNNIVRLHGHGELINQTHLHNFVSMVKHFPHITFALWSKRTDIIRKYFKIKRIPQATNEIPDNLILVYSNPIIDKVMFKPPRPFHKVFNNVSEKYTGGDENCTGQKCNDCRLCYQFDTENIIIEQQKFYGKKQ